MQRFFIFISVFSSYTLPFSLYYILHYVQKLNKSVYNNSENENKRNFISENYFNNNDNNNNKLLYFLILRIQKRKEEKKKGKQFSLCVVMLNVGIILLVINH